MTTGTKLRNIGPKSAAWLRQTGVRTQEDLANAHAQEVQAKIDYEKSLIDLKLAEGTILTALNVEYAAPEPEKPIGFVRSLVPPVPKDE